VRSKSSAPACGRGRPALADKVVRQLVGDARKITPQELAQLSRWFTPRQLGGSLDRVEELVPEAVVRPRMMRMVLQGKVPRAAKLTDALVRHTGRDGTLDESLHPLEPKERRVAERITEEGRTVLARPLSKTAGVADAFVDSRLEDFKTLEAPIVGAIRSNLTRIDQRGVQGTGAHLDAWPVALPLASPWTASARPRRRRSIREHARAGAERDPAFCRWLRPDPGVVRRHLGRCHLGVRWQRARRCCKAYRGDQRQVHRRDPIHQQPDRLNGRSLKCPTMLTCS
jgi:hypothetical protein